jgi:LPXTG-motif cell wall-anchored protein
MEPGDIRTIEYSVTADKAGTYENVATATGLGYIDEEEYSSEDSATAVANNPTVPPTNPPGGGGSTPRQGTVRVRFVDEDDNVLSAEYQFTGRVGTSYETNARDIEGYTLVEVPDNAEGVFINGTITVVYIYNSDSEEETEIDIEEEEIPEGLPEEPFIDEEIPQAGDILPQTGLPIATVPELLGGTLIALGFYFRRKAKKDEE